ncbi:MAG: hypothetical protein KGQ83_11075 [Planctomycetes bacterium]|nr:hypothetical protein [Planctomycetota bacterium]
MDFAKDCWEWLKSGAKKVFVSTTMTAATMLKPVVKSMPAAMVAVAPAVAPIAGVTVATIAGVQVYDAMFSVAQAGVDFTGVTLSTADIFTFTGIILAALGAIWGIKRLLHMGRQ